MSENLEIKRALSSCMKELLREKKFEDVTVAELCERSYISRRTFYRYFQDKFELLNFVHYDDFCRFFDDKTTPHALTILPLACEHLYQNRSFYLQAFDVDDPGAFRDFCIDRLYIYLERDYGSACDSDEERRFYITRILDGLFDSLQSWLRSDPCPPPEEYVAKTFRSLTRFSARFAAIANVVTEELGYPLT